jgi:predicted metal-dependent hydrolase
MSGAPLDLADDPNMREGGRLFAEGRFWDAHEAWERVWIVEKHGSRGLFVQGLVQLAAAMHKLLVMENAPSAERLIVRAREKLGSYPASFEGFAVDELRAQMDACRESLARAVAAGSALAFDRALIPRVPLSR